MDEIKTKEQLKEAFPELTAQIAKEAAAEALLKGAKAERERIAGIDALAMPGFEEIIRNAKADPAKDAGSVAQEIIRAQKEAGGRFLAEAKADAKLSGVNSVPAASSEAGAGSQGGEETVEAAAKAAVEAWKKENGKESY